MRTLIALLTLTAAACGPDFIYSGDEGGGGGESGGAASNDDGVGTFPPAATSGPQPGTSTTAVDGTTTDGSTDDGIGFIDPTPCDGTDGAEAPPGTSFHCTYIECDPYLQDCPEGEKCTFWANDGGSVLNANRCVPVSDTPAQVSETCTMQGSPTSGVDDCDIGLLCWDPDPETLEGQCEALCTGSAKNPQCDDGYNCHVSSGALAVCLAPCDPLTANCPDASDVCVPSNDYWSCVSQTDEVPAGGACEFFNECADLTACIDGTLVTDCTGGYCCSSVCDLSEVDPSAVCLPGQTCVPWWEAGMAPKGYQDLGVCSL